MSYQSSSHHSFDVKLAIQLGSVELAIIVHHFQYWINKNQELQRNFIDGRTWTYQTREEIAACFPYFSSDQVRRFTDKLVQLNILRKANYNKLGIDKTIWYAFENEEMFTIGKIAKSTGKSANPDGNSAKAIPKSIPKSKPTYIKDLGQETEARYKNKGKTLDASRRWGLTEEQKETFEALKSLNIDAEDHKLCFWAKTYTLKRLLEVYNESKHYKANSLRQYMSNLLERNKQVPNANTEANKQFAIDFIKQNPWPKAKIYKKYLKYPLGNDFGEIDFNMDSQDFIYRLMEKHENSKD